MEIPTEDEPEDELTRQPRQCATWEEYYQRTAEDMWVEDEKEPGHIIGWGVDGVGVDPGMSPWEYEALSFATPLLQEGAEIDLKPIDEDFALFVAAQAERYAKMTRTMRAHSLAFLLRTFANEAGERDMLQRREAKAKVVGA